MDIFNTEIYLTLAVHDVSKSVCSLVSRGCRILSEIDNLSRIEVII